MDGNFSLQHKKATNILLAMLIIASMKWASTSPTNILLVFTPKKFKRSMLLFSKELPIHIGKEIKARGRIPIPIAVP